MTGDEKPNYNNNKTCLPAMGWAREVWDIFCYKDLVRMQMSWWVSGAKEGTRWEM